MRGLMKLILWVLGLALAVLIGSKLFLAPTYAVTVEIPIRVSPDKVWERVGDLTKWMSWMRGMERFDLAKGEGREVGSVARAHVYTGLQELELNVQIVEVIPGVRLRYRITGGPQDGITSLIELRADPEGRSTRVRWTESQTPDGVWGSLVAAALKSVITTHHEESLNQLKFKLERGV